MYCREGCVLIEKVVSRLCINRELIENQGCVLIEKVVRRLCINRELMEN